VEDKLEEAQIPEIRETDEDKRLSDQELKKKILYGHWTISEVRFFLMGQ
jgi:hypothetical protein